MERHLFLTGPSKGGKTYMLRGILGEHLQSAGGFITERRLTEDGGILGFDLLPAAAAGGVTGFPVLRFLDYTVTPPVTDNEIFRNQAVQLLREAPLYPFAMLDEFGGFELVIPQFREALLDCLSSDVPIIGVFKCLPNAKTLQKRISLGDKFIQYHGALSTALEKDPDTRIVETCGRGDDEAAGLVRRWMEEYVL